MPNLSSVRTGFYEAGLMRQVATNLFYGWGYNFYRLENQQRTTDQMIRAKIAELLSQAVLGLTAAESEFRKDKIPEPSRTTPFPPAEVSAAVAEMDGLAKKILALSAQIRVAQTPETDLMWQLHRVEAQLLQSLLEADADLVGLAATFHNLLFNASYQEVFEKMDLIKEGLAHIKEVFQARQDLLLLHTG